jgi:hypothetical protein
MTLHRGPRHLIQHLSRKWTGKRMFSICSMSVRLAPLIGAYRDVHNVDGLNGLRNHEFAVRLRQTGAQRTLE